MNVIGKYLASPTQDFTDINMEILKEIIKWWFHQTQFEIADLKTFLILTYLQ